MIVNRASARNTLVGSPARLARRKSSDSSWPLAPAALPAERVSEALFIGEVPSPHWVALGGGGAFRCRVGFLRSGVGAGPWGATDASARSSGGSSSGLDSEFKVVASLGQVDGTVGVQNEQQAVGQFVSAADQFAGDPLQGV